jgi:hypothetical protein
MSTWSEDALQATPTRLKVEASCEAVYAAQSVSWPAWRPSGALWTECLSADVCAAARLCRRQRARAWAVLRARWHVRAMRQRSPRP